MKVIAINGSPRKNWNTDTLLKKALLLEMSSMLYGKAESSIEEK